MILGACMILGKSFNLSELQSLHPWSEANNNTAIEWDLNELTYGKHGAQHLAFNKYLIDPTCQPSMTQNT